MNLTATNHKQIPLPQQTPKWLLIPRPLCDRKSLIAVFKT